MDELANEVFRVIVSDRDILLVFASILCTRDLNNFASTCKMAHRGVNLLLRRTIPIERIHEQSRSSVLNDKGHYIFSFNDCFCCGKPDRREYQERTRSDMIVSPFLISGVWCCDEKYCIQFYRREYVKRAINCFRLAKRWCRGPLWRIKFGIRTGRRLLNMPYMTNQCIRTMFNLLQNLNDWGYEVLNPSSTSSSPVTLYPNASGIPYSVYYSRKYEHDLNPSA